MIEPFYTSDTLHMNLFIYDGIDREIWGGPNAEYQPEQNYIWMSIMHKDIEKNILTEEIKAEIVPILDSFIID